MFQHLTEFLNGGYEILDVERMIETEKVVRWRGGYYWGGARPAHWESIREFVAGLPSLAGNIQRLLQTLHVLLGPVATDKRILERIEAALMASLFGSSPEQRVFYSKAMRLSPLKPQEQEVAVDLRFPCDVRGLPPKLVV